MVISLKLFNRCGVEWLWVDILAMPEVSEAMMVD